MTTEHRRTSDALPDRLEEGDELVSSRGSVTDSKLEAMLRKVRALLAQADHENTSPTEAQTFRAKAEALMYRYRIDEAMLALSRPANEVIGPEWSVIKICNWRSEYRYYYVGIMKEVLQHVGCRGKDRPNREDLSIEMHYVGFPADVRIVDALFTSVQLAFQQKLEPKYNPDESDQVNAWRMRKAGMEGWRIAMAIWGRREDKDLYRARRMYKKEALARGENPTELLGQGNSMKVYRECYADGFYHELRRRLYHMRQSRGEVSQGLELAGREEAINEAFYQEYPEFRPPPPVEAGPQDDEEGTEGEASIGRNHTRQAYTDPRANCKKCQKAKSGYCRDHSYLRPTVSRERAYNYSAARAGAAAARSVDLGSGGSKRLDR